MLYPKHSRVSDFVFVYLYHFFPPKICPNLNHQMWPWDANDVILCIPGLFPISIQRRWKVCTRTALNASTGGAWCGRRRAYHVTSSAARSCVAPSSTHASCPSTVCCVRTNDYRALTAVLAALSPWPGPKWRSTWKSAPPASSAAPWSGTAGLSATRTASPTRTWAGTLTRWSSWTWRWLCRYSCKIPGIWQMDWWFLRSSGKFIVLSSLCK